MQIGLLGAASMLLVYSYVFGLLAFVLRNRDLYWDSRTVAWAVANMLMLAGIAGYLLYSVQPSTPLLAYSHLLWALARIVARLAFLPIAASSPPALDLIFVLLGFAGLNTYFTLAELGLARGSLGIDVLAYTLLVYGLVKLASCRQASGNLRLVILVGYAVTFVPYACRAFILSPAEGEVHVLILVADLLIGFVFMLVWNVLFFRLKIWG